MFCKFSHLGQLPVTGNISKIFSKAENVDDPIALAEQKQAALEKARRKKDEASRALYDSRALYEDAVADAEAKQAQWNVNFERVCLELQQEEENRYAEMIKVKNEPRERHDSNF